jgi:hypothetical protein
MPRRPTNIPFVVSSEIISKLSTMASFSKLNLSSFCPKNTKGVQSKKSEI